MMGVSFGHSHAAEERWCHIPSLLAGTQGHVPGELLVVVQLLIYRSFYQELSVLFITGKKQLGLYKGFCRSSSPSQREAGASQRHPYPRTRLPKGLPSPEQGDAPMPGVG